MKRIVRNIGWSPVLAAVLAATVLSGPGARDASATMGDYCQVPPYVIQNVPPNVMLMIDISGSMFNFAYFDGFYTTATGDDNLCDIHRERGAAAKPRICRLFPFSKLADIDGLWTVLPHHRCPWR